MLQTWNAVRVEHVLATGRTNPLVLECCLQAPATVIRLDPEDEGEQVPPATKLMVVKALGLPDVTHTGLLSELLGNIVAREVGISTPAPALVELTRDFVCAANPSLPRLGAKGRLEPGTGAGCEYLRPGLRTLPTGTQLGDDEVEQAVLVYAFDMIVQNPDRRLGKPNCAIYGERLVAYDFEMAFSFLWAVGQQPQPWEVSQHSFATSHLFHSALRSKEGRGHIDWKPLLGAVSGLTDSRLAALTSWVPTESRSTASRICAHLAAVRDHVAELEIELRRSLV